MGTLPNLHAARYRTTIWPNDNAALRQRGSLPVWFDPDTVWHAGKFCRRGHPETVFHAAVRAGISLKMLCGPVFHQIAGLVESLIRIVGRDELAPDCPMRCRVQQGIGVPRPYHRSGKPSPLLADRTQGKFRRDGAWHFSQTRIVTAGLPRWIRSRRACR
ncbi:transposase [Stagnihabitans tardus]|uniref:Transposase DDE domain-containing protein n=1 Tax=Stagnihabitans tardus TaxID=2699202 RepID=A0AAE5BXM5_9RHOB|nr:hypothetical protein [Stagnihabitans tardus]